MTPRGQRYSANSFQDQRLRPLGHPPGGDPTADQGRCQVLKLRRASRICRKPRHSKRPLGPRGPQPKLTANR